MKVGQAVEALLVRIAFWAFGGLGWRRSLAAGAILGEAIHRLGVRRRTTEGNLALAFPERSSEERARIQGDHYRELGRVVSEYARLGELARAPAGEVVAEVRGLEHAIHGIEGGRGTILITGHYGNFELMGALLGQVHPVDFVTRALGNPEVERLIAGARRGAGVGLIDSGAGIRRVYEALRANRWVAMLIDQDARRHGVFVPFLGRLASTPVGPARIALATGAAVVAGFCTRRPDGRHEIVIEPPLEVPDPRAPEAALWLTARLTARLEHWVRAKPESWFWLHRRWKTPPPATGVTAAVDPDPGRL